MATVEAEIRSIHTKLSKLLREKGEHWATVGWVIDLTGWDRNRLAKARAENLIRYRTRPTGGYEYLLESIPEQFIINKPKPHAD